MTRHHRSQQDEGVALVMVLVFMTIAGLFSAVALSKSGSVAKSEVQLRTRANLQYALDGAVDLGLNNLKTELANNNPTSCTSVGSADGTGSLTLNNATADYTCTTLAGRTKTSADDASTTNYALIVTSSSPDAVQTQSGSDSLLIGGSVYLNGTVVNSDLSKEIDMTSGDLVAPTSSTCQSMLNALTQIQLIGTGQLRTCTEQTLAQAMPTVDLGTAPSFDVSATLGSGLTVNLTGGKHCQVFYPGLYQTKPTLAAANYFVSGTYYFLNTGQWQIANGNTIIGGQPLTGVDTEVASGDCATMNDTTALAQAGVAGVLASINPYRMSSGNTWVFGHGASVDFKNGTALMYSPPPSTGHISVNIAGASTTTGGYNPIVDGADVLTGGTNNTSLIMNANLYAPTGNVEVFSTNNTIATAQAGVVCKTITMKASNAGSGGLVISASGSYSNPPPPFRTVRLVSRDDSGASNATQTAVATISNYSPFTIKVLSWRTG